MADDKSRLKQVMSELAKVEKTLVKASGELRASPGNQDTRAELNAAHGPYWRLLDTKAELERSISRAAGGRQFTVE